MVYRIPTMSNLQRYNSDDIELVIDNTTGEAFATERGYALMSGLSQQAVNKRTRKPDNQTIVKKAETLTTQGLRTNNLIPADTVFLWLMKDNPELAVKMGKEKGQGSRSPLTLSVRHCDSQAGWMMVG